VSAAQAFNLARLEELRTRFEKAAYDFPSLDAVVVYRPDLRREEAERQARNRHLRPIDPTSESCGVEQVAQTRDPFAAGRCDMEWGEEWIPPFRSSIGQRRCQQYWSRVFRAREYHELCCPEFCGPPILGDLWQCTLFGPPALDFQNTALPLFSLLAADAARLILPQSKAEGKALLSHWLIYLADRPTPIVPDSRRRYLSWSSLGEHPMPPMWVPDTPANGQTLWWAARLPNVFRLSRDSVEQAMPPAVPASRQGAAPTGAAPGHAFYRLEETPGATWLIWDETARQRKELVSLDQFGLLEAMQENSVRPKEEVLNELRTDEQKYDALQLRLNRKLAVWGAPFHFRGARKKIHVTPGVYQPKKAPPRARQKTRQKSKKPRQ
jgi:hypothetical protein